MVCWVFHDRKKAVALADQSVRELPMSGVGRPRLTLKSLLFRQARTPDDTRIYIFRQSGTSESGGVVLVEG